MMASAETRERATTDKMDKQVRAAIVGTGSIAKAHMAAIEANHERVEAVATVEVDPQRREAFAAQYGIPHAYAGLDEMLARERPDLVHVCTPPDTHTEICIRCLDAGAWVLCEKPLCDSLAALDQIEAAERRSGAYCCSVFQWRFGAAAHHLRRLMQEGALGRPLLGLCHTTWHRTMQYYGIPWHGRWAHGFGGPTTQLGIHAMDVFLWLLGDWVEVTAEVATLDHDMEVEDVSLALVRFASGALGNIVNSAVSPRQETHIRFDFQRATAEVTALYRYGNEDWRLTPAPGPAGEALPEGWDRVPHDERSSHESQLRQLLECWARGERPLVSGDEVRRTIEFVTCLYKAAFTRQAVRRGSVVPGDAYYTRLYGPDPQPYRPFAET